MSEQSLIVRDDSSLSVVITSEAHVLKATALDSAALVLKVTNPAQQDVAVAALTEIKRILKLAEESRQAAKRPVLDYGLKIDSTVKDFIDDLKKEELRINRSVGDYQALLLAKQRDEEIARRKEIDEIERKKREEMAKAESHEEREAIVERANEEARALPVTAPVRAAGQIVKEEFGFEVTDIWLLARSHPSCVTIEPRRSEIKALLNAGAKVAGVKSWKEVKSSVRLQREPASIEA